MNEQHIVGHNHCDLVPSKHISWTAIFIGALVSVGLAFLLNMFALAIGLSAYTLTDAGSHVLAIGGLIGLIISIIVTMFVGGYTAGYLGRMCCNNHHLGTIYGFTTWVVALILSAVLTTHVGDYVNDYTNNVTANVVVENDPNSPVIKAQTMPAADQNMQMVAEKKDIVASAFVIFALFALGALFSILGAACAFCCDKNRSCCKPKDDVIVTPVDNTHQ